MIPSEWFDILLPAAGAGVVAILATVAVERLGGVVGGVLGSAPTTIVPTAIGFWHAAEHRTDFIAALAIVPVGMLINGAFLTCWRIFPPRLSTLSNRNRLVLTTAGSLTVWAVVAGGAVVASRYSMVSSGEAVFIGAVAGCIALALGFVMCRRLPPAPRGTRHVSPAVLFARGIAAAIAIGLAMWIGKLGHPIAAGMTSVFPAIFLTTMVATWISQGDRVPTGAVGPMLLGSISISVYAWIALASLPEFGSVLGSLIAWSGSVLLATLPAALWLRAKTSREVA